MRPQSVVMFERLFLLSLALSVISFAVGYGEFSQQVLRDPAMRQLGLGVGFILEATRVHFTVEGPIWQRILRYVVGIIVTVIIWRGLALVFPEDPLWLGLPLRLFRYWLAGMWVAYYAPIVFIRLRLAQASPAPDVSLSISSGGIMRD